MTESHICGCEGCDKTVTTACFYPDNETEEPDHYYCYDHAFDQGFCYGCGRFYAGIEQFDFPEFWGNVRGYCEDCSDEIKTSCGEYDEDKDGYNCVDFSLP